MTLGHSGSADLVRIDVLGMSNSLDVIVGLSDVIED
jgi:hypothetical protein